MTPELKIDPWAMEAGEELSNTLSDTLDIYGAPKTLKEVLPVSDPNGLIASVIQRHHNAAGWEELLGAAKDFDEHVIVKLLLPENLNRLKRFRAALAKLKEGK